MQEPNESTKPDVSSRIKTTLLHLTLLLLIVGSILGVLYAKKIYDDQTHFSELHVRSVAYSHQTLHIKGKTDLPNGSIVRVSFDVLSHPKEPDLHLQQEVIVESGVFRADLPVPQWKEYKKAPYQVQVSFSPVSQPMEVLQVVGMKGEYLTGKQVRHEISGMKLVERQIVEGLGIHIKEYSPYDQHVFSTAEYRLADFLHAWKQQNWKGMKQASRTVWQESHKTANLSALFHDKRLLHAEFVKETHHEVVEDVTLALTYHEKDVIRHEFITVRMVKDWNKEFPSAKGTWGVEPTTFSFKNGG